MQAKTCFKNGFALAGALKEYILSKGESAEFAGKASDIAQHVFPVLLWGVGQGPEGRRKAEILSLFSLLCQSGVSNWALLDQSMPQGLRENLFPLLRPEWHESIVKWWDHTAVLHWVGPFFKLLEDNGALHSYFKDDES